ncbi:MAG: glycoside hydrolase family 2 protein [Solirubrobacteraceae bacterium]
MSYSPRLTFLTVLAMLVLVAPAATQPGTLPPGPPDAVELDTGWQIRFDPRDQGLAHDWKSGNWREDWSSVTVPHVFNAKPIDSQFLGTVGWYRMRLTTPTTPAGFYWALRFEGARRDTTVWLNGRRLGRNVNPYEPFTLRALGLKPPGEVNSLVVRVSNKRTAALREGWWNWGGLTRPVELEPVGLVDWDDLGILSDVRCARPGKDCKPIARTDGILYNHTRRTVSPRIRVALTSPSGVVSTKTVTVKNMKPFQRRRIGFPVDIAGTPALWSPVHPNLYSSSVTVSVDGEATQRDQRQVGLRFVRVIGGQLYLNGHRLQLRGASIQEDMPGRGNALRDEDIDKIVDDLKRLGANVTRAQYPLNERLLERMDQAGIMVWSQAPVYHEDVALQSQAGRSAAYEKVRTTVLYARNHPSVMAHSVANELSPYADSKPGTRRFLGEAARIARDLDDTVPAALDLLSYPNIAPQRAYASFGLLGINSYYGWYKGKPGPQSTANFNRLAPFLRSMRRKYPRQAQIITEFGAESNFDGPVGEKESYAFQSRYVDRTLRVVGQMPWLAGAIYWTAREFYVKPNWDGGANRRGVVRDALHNKGLIHYDGTPKPAFWTAKRDFQATPVYK